MVAFNPQDGTQSGSDSPASDRRVINLMELQVTLFIVGGGWTRGLLRVFQLKRFYD